mmetsp:Transcript_1216/g.2033  ORF Transcript_1216/g.2033 Transcript_1216/m.2033 type:complete len:106 (+) Transcript_1216:738-1055(+)
MRHPLFVYACGCFKKSTISASSSFAPSHPATSSNVTPVFGLKLNDGFIFANERGVDEEVLFRNKKNRPANNEIGKRSLRSIYENNLLGDEIPGNLSDDDTEMSIL